MPDNVKKILIFKLCCLGDSVFIIPAVKSLKLNFPDSKITYAYAEWIKSMMTYIPCIDRSILFENVYSRSFIKKLAGTVKFILKVRKEKFDLVLFGHRSNLLSFIVRLCGIKYRLGFRNTKFLTHTAEFQKELPEYKRYLKILSGNGLRTEESLPELRASSKEICRDSFSLKPGEKLLGIFPHGGLNPGTKMHIKRWEIGNYFRLIELINGEFPELKIVVFKGREDSETLTLPAELNALKRTIANELIICCDYFISGDTGSLHIAAAFGIPTISLFGPSDPRIIAPVNNPSLKIKHITIWKKPPCSPCYTPDTAIDRKNGKYWLDGEFICHTGTHECIKSILPEEVFSEFKGLLQSASQANFP